MNRTHLIAAAIMLALGVVRAEPQASIAIDRPAAGPCAPAAPMSARDDGLAGAYTQTRPAVRWIQRLTLVLDPDQTCVLTTEFLTGNRMPVIDRGTWSSDHGTVRLQLAPTDTQPESREVSFERRNGQLVATRWDRERWGSADLKLARLARLPGRPSAAQGQEWLPPPGTIGEAAAEFTGAYRGSRIGPNYWEDVTLVLRPDGTVTMRAARRGWPGPPAMATGTWSADGRLVTLHLPIQYPKAVVSLLFITFYLGTGHTQTEIVLARIGRELVATQYDPRIWGSGDLRVRKK
jgi:hypothetical protein